MGGGAKNATYNNNITTYNKHPRRQLRLSDFGTEDGEVVDDEKDMLIQVSKHLRNRLKTNELDGYLRIADVQPHPQPTNIVKKIDVDKITNEQVCGFLNLMNEGYNIMDTLEPEVLESYFEPYSPSAKSYRTFGGQDVFFHEVAKFLLEVACVKPMKMLKIQA